MYCTQHSVVYHLTFETPLNKICTVSDVRTFTQPADVTNASLHRNTITIKSCKFFLIDIGKMNHYSKNVN